MGYILQLENDNWYVGITERGTDRLYEHFCGLGAKWTKLHKPITIHSMEYIGSNQSSASVWEKKTALEMMCQKGYKSVRGYQWCHIDMPQRPLELISILAKKLAASYLDPKPSVKLSVSNHEQRINSTNSGARHR